MRLPELRIADQMPVFCQHCYSLDITPALTKVESSVLRPRIRQHGCGLGHVKESGGRASYELAVSIISLSRVAKVAYIAC